VKAGPARRAFVRQMFQSLWGGGESAVGQSTTTWPRPAGRRPYLSRAKPAARSSHFPKAWATGP